MKIIGKVKKDQNFTYVYTKDAVYTHGHNTSKGHYGCVKVGKRTATGVVLTQEYLDKQRETIEGDDVEVEF